MFWPESLSSGSPVPLKQRQLTTGSDRDRSRRPQAGTYRGIALGAERQRGTNHKVPAFRAIQKRTEEARGIEGGQAQPVYSALGVTRAAVSQSPMIA